MSASANPDIVDDGLVFLYDTDDGKSYKGEPTTNVMADPLPTAGWGVSNYLSSTATRTYSSENGIPHMEITNVNVDGSYPRINMANLTSTITDGFSISFEAKSSVADAQLYFALYSSGSTKTSQLATLSTEWQRFKFENLTTGFTLDDGYLRFPSSADSGTVYYIRRMQVEQKSHATPFVNGTRSATQGLIDRTGNSTINLSNVSFDSNAQMAFDGTDDYALTTFTPSADDNKTISVWVNFDILTGSFSYVVGLDYSNSTDGFIPISVAPYNGNWVLRMRQQLGTLGTNLVVYSNLIINTGEWINLVISSNGSAFNFYKNGVKGSAVSGTNNGRWFSILNEPIMIGASDWLTNQLLSTTDGKIANVSIYNKQLTDAEVLQNYNATKSRFNL